MENVGCKFIQVPLSLSLAKCKSIIRKDVDRHDVDVSTWPFTAVWRQIAVIAYFMSEQLPLFASERHFASSNAQFICRHCWEGKIDKRVICGRDWCRWGRGLNIRYKTVAHCCFNVGTASQMLAQRKTTLSQCLSLPWRNPPCKRAIKSAIRKRWFSVGLLLGHRLRRWPNFKTTLGECLTVRQLPFICIGTSLMWLSLGWRHLWNFLDKAPQEMLL